MLDNSGKSIGGMKMLLGWEEVDPNRPDNYGRTPLSWASGYGYVNEVKLLLGREEVDPDKPGNNRQTPQSHAARRSRMS